MTTSSIPHCCNFLYRSSWLHFHGQTIYSFNSCEYQREACCRFMYVLVCVYTMFVIFNDMSIYCLVYYGQTSPFLCLCAGSNIEIQNMISAHRYFLQQTGYFPSNVLLNKTPPIFLCTQISDLGHLLACKLRQGQLSALTKPAFLLHVFLAVQILCG
jgi:hypothetical protein